MTTKIYLIEAAGGATPMYTWMSGEEIIKELTSVTKTKYKLKNEQMWQKAMTQHLKGWSILEEDYASNPRFPK